MSKMALHESFRHCNTSYGRKLNSRPLKVNNQPNLGVCRWSATHCWKALEESYKFSLDLITRRKVVFFDRSLWLFSSCKRHLRLKVCVVALDKSHASLVVGDNGVDENYLAYKYQFMTKYEYTYVVPVFNNYFGYYFWPMHRDHVVYWIFD
jgi:hypothetical protein